MEFSLLVIKPEAISRGLVGRILDTLIRKNLRIVHIGAIQFTRDLVYQQYREYMGTEAIRNNITFSLIKGPSLTVVVQGFSATSALRNLIGYYRMPEPGTIRGRVMTSLQEGSIVHASDNSWEFLQDIRRLCPSFYARIVGATIRAQLEDPS